MRLFFRTTHSFTEPNSCVNVPRQERTTGGWLSISESAGLFWGISPAHLFDPKHSALSPPEQCSGALGRNQDVILNWLKGKVCLDLSFLFFYIFLSLALYLYCAAPFSPRPLWSLSCHSTMSLCGQNYREYVLDKDTYPNFALWCGEKKKIQKSGLYYDLMSMMKWDRNMRNSQ